MTNRLALVEDLTTDAVQHVFKRMISMDLNLESPPLPEEDPKGQIVSSVGFTGDATGVIHLYLGMDFAKTIAARMLGMDEAKVDADGMLNDAIGELANMVVGSVKSRLCDDGLPCVLTVPSVIRGKHLVLSGPSEVPRSILWFRNSHHHLLTEILVK